MEDAKDDEEMVKAFKRLPKKRNYDGDDEDTLDAPPIKILKKTQF